MEENGYAVKSASEACHGKLMVTMFKLSLYRGHFSKRFQSLTAEY